MPFEDENYASIPRTTDTERELFFKILELLGLGLHLGLKFLRHLGYFGPDYQLPSWYCEFLVFVIVFCYSTITVRFCKKLSLYIHLPNIYLGVGF